MARQAGVRSVPFEERLQQGLESGALTMHDADQVRAFAEFLAVTGQAKMVERTDPIYGRMLRAQAICDYYEQDGDPDLLAIVWRQRHLVHHYATMLRAQGRNVPESGTDAD